MNENALLEMAVLAENRSRKTIQKFIKTASRNGDLMDIKLHGASYILKSGCRNELGRGWRKAVPRRISVADI
jgi:hypothetical protein